MSRSASPPSWPEPDFSRGLVAGVVQEAATGQVRMLGYLNREAYRVTRETGLVTFWSRSRERLWQKGESSGNVLRIERALLDCDGDALLFLVSAEGPTCHTGSPSCFGRAPCWLPEASPLRSVAVLLELDDVIASRDRERPAGSYTVDLLEGGAPAAGRKVAEEALEAAMAAAFESPDRLADESADLIYHLLVLIRARGVALDEVLRRLAERRR